MEVMQTESEISKKKRVVFKSTSDSQEAVESKSQDFQEPEFVGPKSTSEVHLTEKKNSHPNEILESTSLAENNRGGKSQEPISEEQSNKKQEGGLVSASLTLVLEEPKPNELIESQLIGFPENLEQLVSQEQSLIKPESSTLRGSELNQSEVTGLYNSILKNLRAIFEQYAKLDKLSLWSSNPPSDDLDEDTSRYMNLKEFLLFCKDHSITLEGESKDQEKQLIVLFKLICTSQGLNFEKFFTLLKHINLTNCCKIGNRDLIEAVKLIDQRKSQMRASQIQPRNFQRNSLQSQHRNSQLRSSKIRPRNSAFVSIITQSQLQQRDSSQWQPRNSESKSGSDRNIISKYIYTQKLKNRKTVMHQNIPLVDPRDILKANFQKSINDLEEEQMESGRNALNDFSTAIKSKLAVNKSTSMEQINESTAEGCHLAEVIPVDQRTRNFINYFVNREFHNINLVCKKSHSLQKQTPFGRPADLGRGIYQSQMVRKRSLDALKSSVKGVSQRKSSESPAQHQTRRPNSSFDCSRLAIPLRKPIDKLKENNRINLAKNARIIHHLNIKKKDVNDMRKFDSYHLREQMKIKSSFLRNITWKTINKMKADDLKTQMDDKITAGMQPSDQQTTNPVLANFSPRTKIHEKLNFFSKKNLEQIISYGKIKRIALGQNNNNVFRY
jgi:hypothetical protein